MTIDATTLESLRAEAWALLVRGLRDPVAPARQPTLATISPQGWPEARTVVLRHADPQAWTLDIHTDPRSAKVAALRADPRAGLHIWDATAQLQIRIEARARILTGAEVAELWARVPDPARQSYGSVPPPGTPIAQSLDYDKAPTLDHFAVLRIGIEAMDLVHLGPVHRRARYERGAAWAGQWLAP